MSRRFIEVELAAAIVGGGSAPTLFLAFAYGDLFGPVLYGLLGIIGILVGLEIPLLMRILREELDFEDLVAKVLSFDYLGALVGSLLFAIILVPKLGLIRTSLTVGLFNAGVALLSTWVLSDLLEKKRRTLLRIKSVFAVALLTAGLGHADRLTEWSEQGLYADPIVYAKQSRFQRIVLTRGRGSTQLFLNGNLQFSSLDEHRYHEALVHPAFAAANQHKRVLILGGGDGLALREVLRYAVRQVTLVDLDPAITEAASRLPSLRRLNANALADERVQVRER